MLHLFPRRVATGTAAAVALTSTIVALTFSGAGPHAAAAAGPPADRTSASEQLARRTLAHLPLSFEANRGQVDRRARFVARGDGFTLFLTRRGALFDLRRPGARHGAAVRLDPVGANPAPRIVGARPQRATTSYFRGDDPSRWQRGVRTFARARYQELYPGIDLVFRGDRAGAEYDFVVAAGSDPSRIGYRLRGARGLRLVDGSLVARTAAGDFVHHAPVAYQLVGGHRRPVAAAFRVRHGKVTFALGSYDHSRPLVIDPDTDVDYATALGGSESDEADAVAVADGDLYVTGYTLSPDFPTTTGAYDTTRSAVSDVFVARVSPDGAGAADLVYATYLGGADGGTPYYDDRGYGIAVDGGDVYVVGTTESADFPTTAGAFDTTFGGSTDGFLARIATDGAGAADLVYSSYLGGSGGEDAAGIALEGGDAYVTGRTSSPDYPTTPGALDTTLGQGDVFVTRVSPDGAGAADVVYSTYFGSTSDTELASAIDVEEGTAFITGETYSASLPTTPGAYDSTANGLDEAFVAAISPDGAGAADLAYSTYLGGGRYDSSNAIAVSDGQIYVTGETSSRNFPTTAGAYRRSHTDGYDAFLSQISPDGAGAADLSYSTYLGGYGDDEGEGVALDGGDVYVAASVGADDKYGGAAGVLVARLAPVGGGASDLRHATYLDGYDDDWAGGLAVADGTGYVVGSTYTIYGGIDTTPGAYDTADNGSYDAFAAVVDLSGDELVWPDAQIRRGDRPDVGDDFYGTSYVSTRVRKRHQRVFWITAQNDDNLPDTLRVTGGGTTASKWRIRYYVDDVDISAQMGGEGYQTPELAPGEEVLIKLTVRPRSTARVGSVKTVEADVTSVSDPDWYDAVVARVTVKRG